MPGSPSRWNRRSRSSAGWPHLGWIPRPGAPFTSVENLLRFAIEGNVPHRNETYLTLLNGAALGHEGGVRPIILESEPEILAAVTDAARSQGVSIQDVQTSAGKARLAIVPVALAGDPALGTYVMAYAVDRGRDDLVRVASIYLLASLGSLLLVGVVGWLVAGRLLKPLRTLRENSQRINETDLTERIPVQGNDDVSELTRTYNQMLDRLQIAIDTQRRFLDDAGHELRTPLTILRGQLEVLDPVDPFDVAETRSLLLDEIDRMGRMVEELILLSKAQRPDFLVGSSIDLAPFTDDLVDKARALGNRDWRLQERGDAQFVGDAHRLTQAIMELALNAVKFSAAGSTISIGTRATGRGGPAVGPRRRSRSQRRRDRARLRALPPSILQPRRGGLRAGTFHCRRHRDGTRRPRRSRKRAGRRLDVHDRPPAARHWPRPEAREDSPRYDWERAVKRILIVEDEPRISSFVAKGLKSHGFTPTVVSDGKAGFDYAMSGEFDLVILDIGLPGMDGFTVLDRLRAAGNRVPVIILTARDSPTDTVAGLEGGADDYMPKPFRFDELLARVRLRLRVDHAAEETVLTVGDLVLDLRTRQAQVGARTVDLSAREFALAETLLRNPGQVLSREQLLSRVWGYDFEPGSNVVDVYVGYLRSKLGAERIETVRGMGYRLTSGEDASPEAGSGL